MNLKNKKVTVVGLARSGVSAAKLLLDRGAKVSITDSSDAQKIRENLALLNNAKNTVEAELGEHTERFIQGQDLVVISPGVPLDSKPIVWARENKIPVISEIELAYWFCPAEIIAITGTNGKTTVATLVGEIFREAKRKYVVCGNIGTPFSAEIPKLTKEHVVVLEVSSFQLETIDKFKPKLAAILNLSIDHLDRYADIKEYAKAKTLVFKNQTKDDWSLLNSNDPYIDFFTASTKARIAYFSKSSNGVFKLDANELAAVVISSLFSVPEELAINACRRFKGVEHRLEEVAKINRIKFVNDSKSTNVDSTLWALDAVKEPIILIAGGRDKGSDFNVIRDKLKANVRAIVLLGEAQKKIENSLKGLVVIKRTADLSQAVNKAFSLARPGDCVLFSPMCASFDMFNDYTERGKVFKQAVKSLNP